MTDVPLRILGHTTDSGGGGTLESLLSELQERVEDLLEEEYIVASCSLHNLQTALRNAIIDVLGEGGKLKGRNEFKKNAMQLLHGTYNLRNYLPQPFLHSSWEKSRDVVGSEPRYKEFQKPVLARWWTVGDSAYQIDSQWDVWYQWSLEVTHKTCQERRQ